MQLQTPVTIEPSSWMLTPDSPMLLLGSCFSDEVGSRLCAAGFDACSNPFGTLYNPLSVAACLEQALDDCELDPEAALVFHDGLWHSWMHHSRFSSPDRETCLHRCNETIHNTHAFLGRRPVLMLTFGTAWVFRHKGEVVANCHKLPPQHFSRTRLTVDEIVDTWKPLLSRLLPLTSHILFTVSPIRHMADTAHGNQLSKATLLLAVDRLVQEFPSCRYFDSYELLLDELRDYRFFARDMCHPSDLAADIVFERFLQTFTTPATRQQCLLNRKQTLRVAHNPIIQ